MKGIVILTILAGTTVLCIQAALPNFGTCTYQAYNDKIRNCTTQFIKGLQQNPNADCSIYRESFVNCSAVVVKSCFPVPVVTVEMLRQSLEQALTEELMCKRAGLQYPNPSSLNMTIPCNITTSEYVTKMNNCSDGMVKKWSANRADPTLCREYKDVKHCFVKTFEKYCQSNGDFAEMMKYEYDDYNPFCANNVDPTGGPPSKGSSTAAVSTAPNNVDPTSKVSRIIVSKAVIAISLVVAAIQAF